MSEDSLPPANPADPSLDRWVSIGDAAGRALQALVRVSGDPDLLLLLALTEDQPRDRQTSIITAMVEHRKVRAETARVARSLLGLPEAA